jgi:hypothetical protein
MLPVGEEPRSESKSQQLWQILDGWRASGQQIHIKGAQLQPQSGIPLALAQKPASRSGNYLTRFQAQA